MKARTLLIGLAGLLLVAAVACSGKSTPEDEGTPGGGDAVGPGTNHVLGPEQAPVLIVEYADFQ